MRLSKLIVTHERLRCTQQRSDRGMNKVIMMVMIMGLSKDVDGDIREELMEDKVDTLNNADYIVYGQKRITGI